MNRFIEAQEKSYSNALNEIRSGRKRTHWMWYIFPQIAGLGLSETSRYFAIRDLKEAADYLQHPLLGSRLIVISEVLLEIQETSAVRIFGSPDDLKLKSSMTLFASLPGTNPVFQRVLDKYFNGEKDQKTLSLI